MSDSEGLFRDEALDHLAGQRGPGELLRASAAWTDWAYWALLGLVMTGLAGSLIVRAGSDPVLFVLAPPLKALFQSLHA